MRCSTMAPIVDPSHRLSVHAINTEFTGIAAECSNLVLQSCARYGTSFSAWFSTEHTEGGQERVAFGERETGDSGSLFPRTTACDISFMPYPFDRPSRRSAFPA